MKGIIYGFAVFGGIAFGWLIYLLARFIPHRRWEKDYLALRETMSRLEQVADEERLADTPAVEEAYQFLTASSPNPRGSQLTNEIAFERTLMALYAIPDDELVKHALSVRKIDALYAAGRDEEQRLLWAVVATVLGAEMLRRRAADEDQSRMGNGLLGSGLQILWPTSIGRTEQ